MVEMVQVLNSGANVLETDRRKEAERAHAAS